MTEAARDAAAAAAGARPGDARQPLELLVALLDLERIEEDIFRGVSPPESSVRVFGGQVAGQALVAAGRTVPAERQVHSLHAYFIRGGDPSVPIVYQVDRVRDGRSFTTRRVTAVQHGKVIFALSASFQLAEAGLEHAVAMPDVPPPDSLRSQAEWAAESELRIERPAIHRPFEVRPVTEPIWSGGAPGEPRERNQVWMRADGSLADDPLLHVCVLTYASDLSLLDQVLAWHGKSWATNRVHGASLDHALWFHRPFRADEWFLYDCTSPNASGARGLATGYFFAQDGRLLATVVQEGLLRVID
ncbi:acyl-CoA thioesterase-2 [Tamaricihabitans halophyticus]|uniref:Acyl-CoA thioesterase 2 n=1 Tax=Tamaricihabitans halophyticus TaxID=1262583 RepID=A0A4R2QHS9_9PSEU|nr:acyl-CoA thioesterase II [Tamaricihabitans halophyticus]TCP47928.1 acyl-CoA thioesterase-2 [Tamaricihabitans halophyticus]